MYFRKDFVTETFMAIINVEMQADLSCTGSCDQQKEGLFTNIHQLVSNKVVTNNLLASLSI